MFNSFFQSVFTRSSSQAALAPYNVNHPMPEIIISEEGVLSLLRKLDLKKSPGPDFITTNLLYKYAE